MPVLITVLCLVVIYWLFKLVVWRSCSVVHRMNEVILADVGYHQIGM